MVTTVIALIRDGTPGLNKTTTGVSDHLMFYNRLASETKTKLLRSKLPVQLSSNTDCPTNLTLLFLGSGALVTGPFLKKVLKVPRKS